MVGYRVTKYDPILRDSDGILLGDDWTSISDIGKTFNGSILTTAEYLKTENSYVEAAEALISAVSIKSMCVTDLESHTVETSNCLDTHDSVIEACDRVRNNQILSAATLGNVIRGCLRGYVWCRLTGSKGAYIHFGYDYYMYVGLPKRVRLPSLPKGIFLERLDSPYLTVEE